MNYVYRQVPIAPNFIIHKLTCMYIIITLWLGSYSQTAYMGFLGKILLLIMPLTIYVIFV